MIQIAQPFQNFVDIDGQPLNNGYIYIGTSGQNPETNPIAVYWDAALTIAAAQPIRTINGYLARNGSPARLYANASVYSITVRNLNSTLITSALDASTLDNLRADLAAASGAGLVGGGDQVVASITALRALLKTSGSKNAFVTGYLVPGDGGGGAYWYDSTDITTADNGGSVIVATDGGRWKLVFEGYYAIEQFGAKDGTDSTAAVVAAAATGKLLRAGYGDFTISSPVSIAQLLLCSGADDGQTTFTLTGTGGFVLSDWHARMDGFLIKSAVNNLKFITCPGMSYFSCTNFRLEKVGAATGQIGIEFDTTIASIYFCNIDHFKINVDYPFNITGNSTQVFNANRIGGKATGYCQNFLSCFSIGGVLATDANEFAGYLETGINAVNLTAGALRQNRFTLTLDAVTRAFNGVAVTDANVWEILDGGFTTGGTYPQNQILIGPSSTKVRATDASGQSIANATVTIVTWDVEVFDTLSEFSNGAGVFTAKNAGYYQVDASVRSASVAWGEGERLELRIYKNGVEYASGDWDAADAATTRQRSSSVSALVLMNGTTDTIDVRLIHNQGAAVALDTTATANFVQITRT